MRNWIPTCEVAKIIKKKLKTSFPKRKFSVRSSKYAGGSSISIGWTDGETEETVEKLIGGFHGATFDGMIDLKEYHDSKFEGEDVHFGNDFLFCNRKYSREFIQRVTDQIIIDWGWQDKRIVVMGDKHCYIDCDDVEIAYVIKRKCNETSC